MKKLLIILAFLPLFGWGQAKSCLSKNGGILIFNNTILSSDTITPPVGTTIACDSIVPCDAIIPCDAVYTSSINSLRINRNNYLDDFYKHEETLIV